MYLCTYPKADRSYPRSPSPKTGFLFTDFHTSIISFPTRLLVNFKHVYFTRRTTCKNKTQRLRRDHTEFGSDLLFVLLRCQGWMPRCIIKTTSRPTRLDIFIKIILLKTLSSWNAVAWTRSRLWFGNSSNFGVVRALFDITGHSSMGYSKGVYVHLPKWRSATSVVEVRAFTVAETRAQ